MNYYREIEEKLEKFCDIDWVINSLKREYERLSLKGSPKDITAVDFQAVHGGSGGEDAIQTFCKMNDIDNRIEDLLKEKERLEQALNKLKEHDKTSYEFIYNRYIERMTFEEVADVIGYSINSKHSLYSIKNKAIKQYAFYYFGKY